MQLIDMVHFSQGTAENTAACEAVKTKYRIRRMPEYILHLAAAAEALSRKTSLPADDFGILFASRFGPSGMVAAYMYDLLDYSPDQSGPGHFSHAVFNAPAACIAKLLATHGPCLSLQGFQSLAESAFLAADAWLSNAFCNKVMLFFSDEDCPFTRAAANVSSCRLFLPTTVCMVTRSDGGLSPGELAKKLEFLP